MKPRTILILIATMIASAAATVESAWSRGLRPDPVMTVSAWADAHRVVPSETSAHPGRWNTDLVPFTREIMDCLSPSHPCARVTFKKSAQVAGTEIGTNLIAFIIDKAPGPILAVHPTIDAGKAWAREKLNPTIEATKRLREKVGEQKSREGGGSTSSFKKFPGGFLIITGANSTAGLRQKSIRYLIKDDWSDWPSDIDDQGDPDAMAEARLKSYTRSGQAKRFEVSTPTILGPCRITASYEKSDQRRYYVPCPQCGHEQILRFYPKRKDPFAGGLFFKSREPVRTYYVCEENGCVILDHEKDDMLAHGRWIAEKPGPGRHPGFALNALYSPFEPWDEIAARFLAAKDSPRKLKTFTNLDLGEAWEERGDAPEWEKLIARAEAYSLGTIPPGGLIITVGVDVQKDGLFYEVLVWGADLQSWVIDAGFLPGDTADKDADCWTALTELYERRWPDAYGNAWQADGFGVDAGFNTKAVYEWVRRKPKAIATKGVAGWTAPAIGTPAKLEISRTGKKRKYGGKSWPIGTWSLKAEFYGNLRKEPPAPGAEAFKPGYCHTSRDLPEGYYQQLTAEYLKEDKRRDGKTEFRWVARGENHWHDCRIINMAVAEWPQLGLSRWEPARWARVMAERAVPPAGPQGDMASVWQSPVPAPPPNTQPESASKSGPPGGESLSSKFV